MKLKTENCFFGIALGIICIVLWALGILFAALVIFGIGKGIIYLFSLNVVWTYVKSLVVALIVWAIRLLIA